MIINSLQDLEQLILIMKRQEVATIRVGDLEITLSKNSNNSASEDKPKKPNSILDDPDLFAHQSSRTKFKFEE